MNRGGFRISSFSVLLIMAVCAVAGLFSLPYLKLQYYPTVESKAITVGFTYSGASSRSVESEVTSRLEAALGNIRNIKRISSVSTDGAGSVTVSFDRNARMDDARFETASIIRNVYPSLPKGCSYPYISVNARSEKRETAITFNISGPLPSKEIARYVEDKLMYPLSTMEGVGGVEFYGYTPFELVITFDEERSRSLGISASDIAGAISSHFSSDIVGLTDDGVHTFTVRLVSGGATDLGGLPVRCSGNRLVRLGDIATVRYQECEPDSYYRLNGLNTLNLVVYSSAEANIIELVKDVRTRVLALAEEAPEGIGVSVGYDSSKAVSGELHKICLRTLLCIAILLVFVFVVSRSWMYSMVIVLTLAVNILISAVLYLVFGIQIHIYTLAGITVSLGIVIDNSIVMIDHWTRYADRKIMPAIICSVLTTVAALMVIYLLPEEDRRNLSDFASVMAINLSVSILVAVLFVPALLDYLPLEAAGSGMPFRRRRKVMLCNILYSRYISWGLRHKWVLVLVFVLAFGIPTVLLPSGRSGYGDYNDSDSDAGFFRTVSRWKPYARNRHVIDKYIGGSFALFHRSISRMRFLEYRTRQTLNISASLPEGCSVHQLDHIMRFMENYLAKFDEIEMFETRVSSYKKGTITVMFKPEYEKGGTPSRIKQSIISMASDFGGANWSVSGFDRNSFDNHISIDWRDYGINLDGYNYDQLMLYGERIKEHLKSSSRVRDVEIWGTRDEDSPLTEYNLNYDTRAITASGVNPYRYYSRLQSPLFNGRILSVPYGNEIVGVRLKSSASDSFDAWHIENEGTEVDGRRVKLSQVGEVYKDRTGLSIRRKDQSYSIAVRFNYLGQSSDALRYCEREVEYASSILPVGYKAYDDYSGWASRTKETYFWHIMLVIAAIFVICSVHFNSLRYPVSIIWLIPISFIGLFLAFGLSDVSFDEGGYAAFVVLAGITVNAGIYLVSSWTGRRNARSNELAGFIRAFDLKLWPISLTILSTVLGLVPFLSDGPDEAFWFDFALGTIAGLLFSIIALVFYLPVFLVKTHAACQQTLPNR